MMKRLISLLLAMLTVVLLLASCSNENTAEDVAEDAARYTTTLNMWVMTESALVAEAGQRVRDGVVPDDVPTDEEMSVEEATANGWSPEQKEAFLQVYEIQAAVNKITKAKFKTQLNLVYVTEDQYYEKLEAAFLEHEQVIANTDKKEETTEEEAEEGEEVEEETVIVDGISQLKYPEIEDYMVDVYFLSGFERYRDYKDREWTVAMDTYLESSATEISKYVNSIFLSGAKVTGTTHAIPNYNVVGEYTYLMVDAELLADYARMPEKISTNSIYDSECKAFLDYVYAESATTGIYPIYTDDPDGKVPFSPVHYWSHDLDSIAGACQVQGDVFSLFGNVYADTDSWGRMLAYTNLLTNKTYMDNLATKKYYENTAGYVTTDPNAKAAVHVVTGGWELREQYEEMGYTPLIMHTPRATTETVFDSMLAIGGHSEYPERAMEIISLINTDAELLNIIQYGVQDVNYELHVVKSGDAELTYLVPTENNVYEMELGKIGNAMLAYPVFDRSKLTEWDLTGLSEEEKLAKIAEIQEEINKKTVYLRLQNLEATTDPTLGVWYNLAGDTYQWDEESIRVINAVSARLETYLNSLTSIDGFRKTIADCNNDNAKIAAALISRLGSDITYTLNGEEKTVNASVLKTAMDCMADSALNDEGDNDKESPYAFYRDWLNAATIPTKEN